MTDPVVKTLDQIILLYVLVSSFEFSSINLVLNATYNKSQVEWSGGPETMEETLGRIHQKGEAAVKRERAMAYAFSHQVS
jgi:hypothetical protein